MGGSLQPGGTFVGCSVLESETPGPPTTVRGERSDVVAQSMWVDDVAYQARSPSISKKVL